MRRTTIDMGRCTWRFMPDSVNKIREMKSVIGLDVPTKKSFRDVIFEAKQIHHRCSLW
jgi:hypothetical protein